eukprot:6210496-Pleurochrysis_carterae.AAC.2
MHRSIRTRTQRHALTTARMSASKEDALMRTPACAQEHAHTIPSKERCGQPGRATSRGPYRGWKRRDATERQDESERQRQRAAERRGDQTEDGRGWGERADAAPHTSTRARAIARRHQPLRLLARAHAHNARARTQRARTHTTRAHAHTRARTLRDCAGRRRPRVQSGGAASDDGALQGHADDRRDGPADARLHVPVHGAQLVRARRAAALDTARQAAPAAQRRQGHHVGGRRLAHRRRAARRAAQPRAALHRHERRRDAPIAAGAFHSRHTRVALETHSSRTRDTLESHSRRA